MKAREAIARRLAPGMITRDEADGLVRKAVVKARQDGMSEGFRRLMGKRESQRRELSALSQEAMYKTAYYYHDVTSLGKRIPRDVKNAILKGGVKYSVPNDRDDKQATQVLKEHWLDSMNAWPERLGKRVEFLGVLGVQCWPVVVNPHNGRVWVSYIDPQNIRKVATHPDFPEMPTAVRLAGSATKEGKTLKVIRETVDPRDPTYGFLDGECFYVSVNNPPNDPFGRSDCVHLYDIIWEYEKSMFKVLERAEAAAACLWDVTLNGASPEECVEFERDHEIPDGISLRAHNEEVKWDAVVPRFGAYEVKAMLDMVRTFIAMGANVPDSWLGQGGKAYQTEAEQRGQPAAMNMQDRQEVVRQTLTKVFQFVLDRAVLARVIQPPEKGARYRPEVHMAEIFSKDLKEIVDTLLAVSQALMIGEGQGWIEGSQSAIVFATLASLTGVKVEAAAAIHGAAPPNVTKDYRARQAIVDGLTRRVKKIQAGGKVRELRLMDVATVIAAAEKAGRIRTGAGMQILDGIARVLK